RDGSTLTISVVSDNTGKFSFPASKLGPGRYSLAIRAVGYDLAGPKTADVAAGSTTAAAVKLRPARDLAKQHTNTACHPRAARRTTWCGTYTLRGLSTSRLRARQRGNAAVGRIGRAIAALSSRCSPAWSPGFFG